LASQADIHRTELAALAARLQNSPASAVPTTPGSSFSTHHALPAPGGAAAAAARRLLLCTAYCSHPTTVGRAGRGCVMLW